LRFQKTLVILVVLMLLFAFAAGCADADADLDQEQVDEPGGELGTDEPGAEDAIAPEHEQQPDNDLELQEED